MNGCRLSPIEICLDRLFLLDWYDGITECIALDGEDSVYVIKRIQEVDVFERTLCFLYTYDVRVLDDPSLVELIKANSKPNEYVDLYGSGPWYEPILESEAFREEHWVAFDISLGTRTIYRVENCSGQ